MIIFSCHYKYAYSYSNVIIFKSLWINDMLFVASFKLTLFSPKYNHNILKLLPWLSNFQGRPLDNCLLGISTCTSYRHSNLKTSKTKLLFPPNILAFSTLILLTPFFQLYRPKTLVPSWTPLSLRPHMQSGSTHDLNLITPRYIHHNSSSLSHNFLLTGSSGWPPHYLPHWPPSVYSQNSNVCYSFKTSVRWCHVSIQNWPSC